MTNLRTLIQGSAPKEPIASTMWDGDYTGAAGHVDEADSAARDEIMADFFGWFRPTPATVRSVTQALQHQRLRHPARRCRMSTKRSGWAMPTSRGVTLHRLSFPAELRSSWASAWLGRGLGPA